MPRRFPPFLPFARAPRWTCWLSILVLLGVGPRPASADLFYKVEQAVAASGLSANADQSVPMVVTGLNASGRMVGFYALQLHPPHQIPQQYLHAFAWDNATHTRTDFNADLPSANASSSMALCVNSAGTVAGVCWNFNNSVVTQIGFHWQNGVATTFLSPEGQDIDSVIAINASGHVIGTYFSADDSNVRGFFWDGTTCTDLGDFGDSDNPCIWPQALNDSDRVVGTSYQTNLPPYTPTAFVWQGGVISPLDGADDYANTRALGVNNVGAVIGSYVNVGANSHYTVAGGFYWLDGAVTDLGSLGGGSTVPFSLTATGQVFGTSYGAEAALHLFGWNAGAIVNLGAAHLNATDLDYQMTGVNAVGAIAGFVRDANNHILAALGTGGLQYRLTTLLPAYLAFTQMSSAYGSQVLINDAGMIACAGTSATGQQMALLLSVDPDTDNDGLPDSWETQYYGHLGVGKNDLAAGGDGLTNWQAYQQGTNPNDFYNGKPAKLNIVSGNAQSAPAGSYLPAPLVISVTNSIGTPASNASAIFTVTSGGALLQAKSSAMSAGTATLQTDGGGQAHVYVLLPATAQSNQITTTSGNAPAQTFTATATAPPPPGSGGGGNNPPGNSPFAPSNVVATLNSDGSLDVSWQNSEDNDSGQFIPVQVKMFDGSFVTQTVSADQNSAHFGAPAQ